MRLWTSRPREGVLRMVAMGIRPESGWTTKLMEFRRHSPVETPEDKEASHAD